MTDNNAAFAIVKSLLANSLDITARDQPTQVMYGSGFPKDKGFVEVRIYLVVARIMITLQFIEGSGKTYGIGWSPTDLMDPELSPLQHHFSPLAHHFSPSWDHLTRSKSVQVQRKVGL